MSTKSKQTKTTAREPTWLIRNFPNPTRVRFVVRCKLRGVRVADALDSLVKADLDSAKETI